jgi:hypothetical protein
MTQINDYIDQYSSVLGKLIGNLSSLELILRVVLHEASDPKTHNWPQGIRLTQLKPGDIVPLNHFTNWQSLTELIVEYNSNDPARGPAPKIDPGIATLRNAFAHGRVLSDDAGGPLVLFRFKRPARGATEVEIAAVQVLTLEWMIQQQQLVRVALDTVWRYFLNRQNTR